MSWERRLRLQARRLQDFLQDEKVEQLPWPPYSPDLNPIEHGWDALDHAIRQREVQPTNLGELADAVTQEWVRCTHPEIPKQAG